MASQKRIFLVALLLTIALIGCHGRGSEIKRCKTNRECPACELGGVRCLKGVCTCVGLNLMQDADVALQNGCITDSDCIKICGESCPPYSCVGTRCLCAC